MSKKNYSRDKAWKRQFQEDTEEREELDRVGLRQDRAQQIAERRMWRDAFCAVFSDYPAAVSARHADLAVVEFRKRFFPAAVQSPGNLQASTEGAQGDRLTRTDSKVSPDSTKEGEGE